MVGFCPKMCFQEAAYQENKNVQGKKLTAKTQQQTNFFQMSYYMYIFNLRVG